MGVLLVNDFVLHLGSFVASSTSGLGSRTLVSLPFMGH